MLEKTIKSVIKRKIDNWLESIDDEEIRRIIAENLVVTGGCIPSLMINETPKDYDVYLKTKEAVMAVSRYYVDRFNEGHPHKTAMVVSGDMVKTDGGSFTVIDPDLEAFLGRSGGKSAQFSGLTPDRVKIYIPQIAVSEPGAVDGATVEDGEDPLDHFNEEDEEKPRYRPVYLSSNAITLSHGIQLVVRFYGNPEEIHDTYDYEHTKAFYLYKENELSIPHKVYELVHNKTLIYTGSRYPLCSLIRMRKFIKRGWTINAGQILKMCLNLQSLDLTDPAVLEDQLIGVDSLYFAMLIDALQRDSEGKSYTAPYIIGIIERIFG